MKPAWVYNVHAWAATYTYLVKRFTRNDGGDKQGDDCECQRGGVKRPLMVLRRGLVTQRAAFDSPQSPENFSISFAKPHSLYTASTSFSAVIKEYIKCIF